MQRSLWGAALAVCGALPAWGQDPVLEAVYGVRTRLPVSQIVQVVVADPELLEWELVAGDVFVLGRKKGQTVMYLWNSQGVQAYVLQIQAPAKAPQSRRDWAPFLRKEPDQLSGFYSVQSSLSLADQPQSPLLQQGFLAEWPLNRDERLWARGSLWAQSTPTYERMQSLRVPFIQAAYQSPSLTVDVGDSALQQPLQQLNPQANTLKGLQVSVHHPSYRYSLLSGLNGQPLTLYQNPPSPGGAQAQRYFNGLTGQWQMPLDAEQPWGMLGFQGLGLSQMGLDPGTPTQHLLAGGMSWSNQERVQLQLGLGSNFQAAGLMAQGFYHHDWPGARDWMNISGLYRHFGAAYPNPGSPAQDFGTVRINSGFANGWGLAGSGSSTFSAGSLTAYQISARLGRQLKTTALNLYGQGMSSQLRPGQHRHSLAIGGMWRQGLPITGQYSWLWNQASNGPDNHGHRLQFQARLWQYQGWQINASSHSLLQNANSPAPLFTQSLMTQVSTSLDRHWLIRGNLGYTFAQTQQQRAQNQWQTGLALDWLPSPVHQGQLALNYQYLEQPSATHLITLFGGYQWRFGYQEAHRVGTLSGRIAADPPRADLSGIRVTSRGQSTDTDAQGRFTLEQLPLGDYPVLVDSDTLPQGYEVVSDNPAPVVLSGEKAQHTFTIRRQRLIQGVVFASPLLARGLDDIVLLLDGTTPITTRFGGRFALLTSPEDHTLELDITSLPEGYRLSGPLNYALAATDKAPVHIVFEPQIQLDIRLRTAQGQPVTGTTLTATSTSDPRQETQVSDAQGAVRFTEVLPGEVVITGAGQRWRLTLPDQPGTLSQVLTLP